MIYYNYELDFCLDNESSYTKWIDKVISSENFIIGEISYIFCDDEYLLNINKEYLNHDFFTDIISFDYTEQNIVNGDIFISIERVKENALMFNVSFIEELHRVMIHGILHYCGYKDKTDKDSSLMRHKENEKILLFHVEQ